MYLPYLKKLNENTKNTLHVFRIKGLTDTNPVFLLHRWISGMISGRPGPDDDLGA